MTTKELKEKYLKFFEERGHKIISSASLIPENDPTVLFTTAGMHPLVPYLLGEKHPMGDKLVNVQKCIRTGDIDMVGDDWHLTFFEMLGNWGLGSYWKEESIKMSFDFLIKELNLPIEKLSVSVFAGDSDAPKDEVSAKTWESLGILKDKIRFLGKEDNWWGPAGKSGPCGPCTEIFYDSACHGKSGVAGGGVEIWNNVFMEYNKKIQNSNTKVQTFEYEPLKQKNVDTGMGVERTTAILNNVKGVYEIEPLKSIVGKIKELSEIYDERGARIIADHIRASVFIISDGIMPSNVEQGYVLRRLIRRAIRYGKKLGIKGSFTHKIAGIIEIENKDFVIEQLTQEEEKFGKTLEKGLKEFEKKFFAEKSLSETAFYFFSTLGFPLEMFLEELKNKGIKYDEGKIQREFDEQLKGHQELSRTATAGKFKSGLADNSEQVVKYHTATHLLLASLRKVLGNHIFQKGSNITAERLRFDFSHSEKLTKEQLQQVEDMVNEQIQKSLLICCEEMSLEEAKKKNAMGIFENKYGDRVKVYTVGNEKDKFSCEICSGPHVTNTNQLGHFKITKEEASSSGVRRIKAILE
ncbi:MAG: alanine--tRNA ligase [Candidatus Portnoybacteria bacterium]|nr:alanine--tRNA ligase [Candidatus Portnoybacteria bacterium]